MSDVAEELSVSMSQVYHMVRSGELPAIKVGGRGQWRIERARLEEYIDRKYGETAQWVQENPLAARDEEAPEPTGVDEPEEPGASRPGRKAK
jgi:excisionase family DNA binding protein